MIEQKIENVETQFKTNTTSYKIQISIANIIQPYELIQNSEYPQPKLSNTIQEHNKTLSAR